MEDYDFEAFRFAADAGELIGRDGAMARLEPRPAAVLECLCSRPGRVVPRSELLDLCWGEGSGSDEALTQCIAQIRRALQEIGQPASIVETRARVGYRFTPPAVSRGSSVKVRPVRLPLALAAIVILALLALWIADPHALRHFFRHSLGLYPPS